MKVRESEIIRFDGKQQLNQAQTLAALQNYAVKQTRGKSNLTTEVQEQRLVESIKHFFQAIGFRRGEYQKYSMRPALEDKKKTPITMLFDENGDVSAMITSKYNENYGKGAAKKAIDAYIKENGLDSKK